MDWYIRNGDYPYIDGVQTASPFRLKNPAPIEAWNIFDGRYPHQTTCEVAQPYRIVQPGPTWGWKVIVEHEGAVQSDDYPVLVYDPPYTFFPVKQYGYITVHHAASTQEDFDTNGLRILRPTKADIVQADNDEYELTMEHPIDRSGAWEHLVEGNYIKCLEQIYRIYRVVNSIEGSNGEVQAYARHVSYELSNRWIYMADISAVDGQKFIDAVSDASIGSEHSFRLISDIEEPCEAELSECTMLSALIGLATSHGAHIIRDNFDFFVNKEIGERNAFDIRVGLNMLQISREVDYTDYCTDYRVFDGFGSHVDLSVEPVTHSHIYRSITLKYDEKPSKERLRADGAVEFAKINAPYIKYTVKVKDLKNNPDYADFVNIPEFNVGDSGRIYDERLGIYTNQTIIRRKINGITGEVTEVTFGNTDRSWTKPTRDNRVTSDDRFVMDRVSRSTDQKIAESESRTDSKIDSKVDGYQIPDTVTSCDQLIQTGRYYTLDDTQAASLVNAPFDTSFAISVSKISATVLIQTAESISGVKKRAFDGSSWTDWSE